MIKTIQEIVFSLDKINVNTEVEIIGFESSKNYQVSDFIIRLQEIGFVVGARIKLLSKLPFGGPMAFWIKEAKIAIRQEDARRILVKPFS